MIKRIARLVIVVAACGLTLLPGSLYPMRNATATPADVRAVTAWIGQLPHQFGDWQLQSTSALSESTLGQLRCIGAASHTFANTLSGDRITVAMMAGPAGPLAAHTPEVCYASRDYERLTPPERITIEADRHADEFWSLSVKSRHFEGGTSRVFYAWNYGSGWQAPDYPRLSFGGLPLLYKIQIEASEPLIGPNTNDTGLAFLRALLPRLTVPGTE